MGEFPGENPCCQQRIQSLTFAKKHLDDPQDFWRNILWTDESKIELFGRCAARYICRKNGTAFDKNIMPTVKHGGASVMFWDCFAALGPGQLAVMDVSVV